MSSLAARVGDKTGHGKPLGGPGIGSPNVFIGGLPAWRALLDISACPLSDGPKPHGAGVVVKGSTTVFINFMPAARMLDQLVEASAPNPITEGCESVLIGD